MAKSYVVCTIWDKWVYTTPEINYVGYALCIVQGKLWLVWADL